MAEAGEDSVFKGTYPDDDNPPYAVHLRDRKDEPVQIQGRRADRTRGRGRDAAQKPPVDTRFGRERRRR